VYASWNGATQLVSWRVLAGLSASHLALVAAARRSGFETAIPIRGSYATYEVQAIAANQRVLGASAPFTLAG
jgi:hypothetical protein